MSKSYQSESDQQAFGQIKSQLYIYWDEKAETIAFAADWEDNDKGIENIAEIFYQLKHEDLIERILAVLYKQCVLEDRMTNFNSILKKIHSKVLDNLNDEEIVFKPTAQGDRNV